MNQANDWLPNGDHRTGALRFFETSLDDLQRRWPIACPVDLTDAFLMRLAALNPSQAQDALVVEILATVYA